MLKNVEVGVIGAGGWGTALAIAANRAGSHTALWTRNPSIFESVRKNRTNQVYLPDVFVDPEIDITDNINNLREAEFLVLAIPAQNLRSVSILLSDRIESHIPLVVAAKGIEQGSLSLMHEVLADTMPNNPVLILSGPNFAVEVAKGLPSATTVASEDERLANRFIYAIGGKYFRPYYSDDVVATQIGGAVKNVIAIACGIVTGLGLGENARAALITRGLAEMMRLAEAKGGRRDSLMGLSGIGDLMLCCNSPSSRNFTYGLRLGEAANYTESIRRSGLTEGIATSESVTALAGKLNVSMPLCRAVCSVLRDGQDVQDTIRELLERPFVSEVERSSFSVSDG